MKNKLKLITFSATLFAGFIPTLLLSLYYGIFYSREIVELPLIYNTSVMIGDAFLLPLVNAILIHLLYELRKIPGIVQKGDHITLSILFLLSLGANVVIHLGWTNDQVTDFIAFQQGQMSVIGIWHLMFSAIETTVLIVFVIAWYRAIKRGVDYLFLVEFHKLWKIIFAFTMLGFVDMLNKYFFVFTDMSFRQVLSMDKFAFLTPSLAVIMYVFLRKYESRSKPA